MKLDRTTLLLSLARFASAIARLCLGPLLPILTLSLSFDEASKPSLLSAYSTGYILTQIGGGYIADKHGFSKVIAFSVGISSMVLLYLSTLATTTAQWTNAFFVMGLVTGPLFPAGSAAISENVSPSERAASAAIVDAAASAGTCIASMTPLIASQFGWRSIYFSTAVGLATIALATPNLVPFDSVTQKHEQSDEKPPRTSSPKSLQNGKEHVSAGVALMTNSAILTYTCHAVDNFSKYTVNAYASTLLFSKFESPSRKIGLILGFQAAVGVMSKVMVGSLSLKWRRTLLNRGRASALGFAIQGICLCLAMQAKSEVQAAICFTISALFGGLHSSGYRPLYMEIAPEYAGAMSGIGNTIASVASVLGPMTIGALVSSKDQNWGFVSMWMLGVNVLGFVAAMIVALHARPAPQKKAMSL